MITNRFRQAFKNAFIPFILFAGVFGVSAFISCSSTPDDPLPPGGNEGKQYCVYVDAQKCFPGPYTVCPGDGLLTDDCPFGNSGETKSYEYCVYPNYSICVKGAYTDCPSGGVPADECPFEGGGSSSSVGGSDLPEYAYCVYSAEALCLDGPFSSCILGGVLSNECPFPRGGLSSSSAVGGTSSSSVSGVVSSSSVGGVVSSSSAGGNVVVGNGGPVSVYGELKASGNRLVGSKTGTTAVQVRGVSLGWSNTNWESAAFFNATTVNAMVDSWKAEIIRVPIGYSESGGYKNDPSNLTRVKAAINAAIAKDVYVIIDWHSHNAHNETDAATAFFTEMAQTYGSYDNVIFEIYNEPKNITWATIKTYANTIIDAIRTYSDNLILVGTPNWAQDVNVAANSPISKTNIAYVVHFYANEHSLDGYTAGGSTFRSAVNSVLNAGYPVFASEYGTVSADGNGTHNASASNTWHTFMDNNKISSCAWSVNDKAEASAFFGTGSSFDMSSWTNTSKMTASGKYIFEKLGTYANSAPWRGGSNPGTSSGSVQSSSSGSGGNVLYCDFGIFNSYGGGCYIISSASECDMEYGTVRNSCPRKQYCDFGPETSYGGGCFEIEDANDCDLEYGTLTNSCGSPGFNGGGGTAGKWCVDHDFQECFQNSLLVEYGYSCYYDFDGILMDSCPAGYERYTD